MTPLEQYRRAAERALALIEALSDQPSTDGENASAVAKRTLKDLIAQSVVRAERGDAADGAAAAASLSRTLVDGNGPRDPAHPLFAAFAELDSARAALRDTRGSSTDSDLSAALVRCVWRERAAIPGRHPENISDPDLAERVRVVIADLDAIRPGDDAEDLFAWSDREARAVAAKHAILDEEAIVALRALLSWQWR
ncbi:hypothetical protein LK09_02485 [Microbacterium mangrovi]|uniref:Uncharacterized protein n=1 Tax=Microbacterium mangrovi TaxID=1348253 RepID=A0A0B2A7N1_9MICO|nr:hypothetical protein [Microbacterium mangrovi]KHK99519.1 hypothetical protein LK09_02485 [Microbacterium mangrovi]